MQNDKDLVVYLQKALGYGLTGDTSEDIAKLSGVLNWCLEGLWLIREATAKYRHDSDKLTRFVEEMLVADPEGRSGQRNCTKCTKIGACRGSPRKAPPVSSRRWGPLGR